MMAQGLKRWRWAVMAGLLLVVGAAVFMLHRHRRSNSQAAATHAQGPAPTPSLHQTAPMQVTYSLRKKDDSMFPETDLLAEVNGKTQVVMSRAGLDIVDVGDFDGSGATDALISTFGGGNAAPTSFSLVSGTQDGRFEVIDDFAYSWSGDAVTENWHGRWSAVIVSEGEGDLGGDVKRRFVLENGKAIAVEEQRHQTLQAVVEMTTGMFDGSQDDTHELEFDLDGDGKNDVISGGWWPRWSLITWSVSFADGKQFQSNLGCHRVGVLETKTNGVHDLVCNQDLVFKWDGHTYKEPAN